MGVDQPPEGSPVVVVFEMGKFMDDDVFDAIARSLHQVGVQDDLSGW